jgi:hydroxylamine reductase
VLICAGHYGGPWQLQKMEFARFPGAIVMTSNCLIEPQRRYKDRLFTRRVVGWPGVRHIEDGPEGSRPDFSPVIAAALSSTGFGSDALDDFPRLPPMTVGFGQHAILGVADKVIAAAKSGALKHVFVIGGCDGSEGERRYRAHVQPPPVTSCSPRCCFTRFGALCQLLPRFG